MLDMFQELLQLILIKPIFNHQTSKEVLHSRSIMMLVVLVKWCFYLQLILNSKIYQILQLTLTVTVLTAFHNYKSNHKTSNHYNSHMVRTSSGIILIRSHSVGVTLVVVIFHGIKKFQAKSLISIITSSYLSVNHKLLEDVAVKMNSQSNIIHITCMEISHLLLRLITNSTTTQLLQTKTQYKLADKLFQAKTKKASTN